MISNRGHEFDTDNDLINSDSDHICVLISILAALDTGWASRLSSDVVVAIWLSIQGI